MTQNKIKVFLFEIFYEMKTFLELLEEKKLEELK